eukprot:10576648-Karenia_brevis.AAC.1
MPGPHVMRSTLIKPPSMYGTFIQHIKDKHEVAEGAQVDPDTWHKELAALHDQLDRTFEQGQSKYQEYVR